VGVGVGVNVCQSRKLKNVIHREGGHRDRKREKRRKLEGEKEHLCV
jgi:hypothetical protein